VGANYANTAYDTPFWEELSSGKGLKELSFAKEFRDKNLISSSSV